MPPVIVRCEYLPWYRTVSVVVNVSGVELEEWAVESQ
jgi:hypothetical protein